MDLSWHIWYGKNCFNLFQLQKFEESEIMNWSLGKCFNLLYSFPVVYFLLYMNFNSLKMTCTYSSVMVPQLSLADVIRFSLPLLVIICCCLGGTRSGFPHLPLPAWGNHPTCLQWSHQEPLLLWTLLNHLVSEALALSTCVLLRILTMCFSLYRAFLDSLPGAWLSCERVYWAEESWIPGGPFPLHVVNSMFWWPLN